ncbi:MAG: hypothetical protein RH917_04670 [Lacipirellulaceae bacterium]
MATSRLSPNHPRSSWLGGDRAEGLQLLRWITYGVCLLLPLLVATPASALQDNLASSGYQELLDLLGPDVPVGEGVPLAQIESGNNYRPSFTSSEFSHITFNDLTTNPSTGTSNHATNVVARSFYGNNPDFAMARGAHEVAIYETVDWLNDVANPTTHEILTTSGDLAKVQNFSWVGTFAGGTNPMPDDPASTNRVRLAQFDRDINDDDYTAVVGLNNGSSQGIPWLVAHSYNAIAVGRSDGNHSTGLTIDTMTSASNYGPGRSKPDLVADATTSSRATATVSSAAAVLRGLLEGTDGDRSEPIKAILMAGATKDSTRFTFNWSRDVDTPSNTYTTSLDDTYGAGELNIFNSYKIQLGGQFDGGTDLPSAVNAGAHGWDYGNVGIGEDRFYTFTVAEGITAQELSIILTWNTPGGNNGSFPGDAPPLANLDLELLDSSGEVVLDHLGVFGVSASTVENVEHLYLQDLAAGDYTLRIAGDASSATDYGLAWRTETLADMVNADFDDDGFVDGADLLIFQRGFGKVVNATHADGDADGDGDVDADDLAAINAGFGGVESVSAVQFAAFLASVPEPSSFALFWASMLLLSAQRGQRRT